LFAYWAPQANFSKEGLGWYQFSAAVIKRLRFERRFNLLVLELPDEPDSLLSAAKKTRDALVDLGEAMAPGLGPETRP
jgi:hypothetical protein